MEKDPVTGALKIVPTTPTRDCFHGAAHVPTDMKTMESSVKREGIDPNSHLKNDCGSEWHDDIINLPANFRRQHDEFMQEVTKNSRRLPAIKHKRGSTVSDYDEQVRN